MTVDFDQIRADVAEALFIAPEDIGLHDNLADLGLDSMRMMSLVALWQEKGMEMDFLAFAEETTLASWNAALEAHDA